MKTFLIFLIAVCAIALTTAKQTWNQQSSSFLDEDYTNTNYQSRNNQNKQTSPYSYSSKNNQDYDDNQQPWQRNGLFDDNSFSAYNANSNQRQQQQHQQQQHQQQQHQQQQHQQQQHQQQQRQHNRQNQRHNQNQSNEDYYDDSESNDWTIVQPFQTKINRRLEESTQLSTQPEIKRKILQLTSAKMSNCKNPGAGNKNRVNRHCAGRATGQIMQVIAAFENGELPGSTVF